MYHIPILGKEIIENIIINKDGVYLDCTLGGGGHSELILNVLSDKGRLISIDQDEEAIKFSKKRLEKFGNNVKIYKENFSNLDVVLYLEGVEKVDGIIMDLGVSSNQLDQVDRGFSYRFNSKLDMRMDKNSKKSAYDVVNSYSEEELAKIIYEYGEEPAARKIAKNIVEYRKTKSIETTFDLVEIVRKSVKRDLEKHPAKRTFQAIRIEVNDELNLLEIAIKKAIEHLCLGGRIGIITFHSLEDRIVKNLFKEFEKGCVCPADFPICVCNKKSKLKIISKKPIIPSEDEIKFNNRAHSSKLRVAERK